MSNRHRLTDAEEPSPQRPLRVPSPSRYQVDDVPPPERVPSWWEGLLRYGWVVLVPLIAIGLVGLLEAGGQGGSRLGRMGVFELDVGDCFDAPGAAITRSQVDARECNELHQYEVVAVVSYPIDRSDRFPGDEALAAHVALECELRFADYVGIPYSDSVYFLEYWMPTPDAWEAGGRQTICAAFDPQQPLLEASVRSSER